MSEPSHKYTPRVAKTIVENAIRFGMPVPKVETMYGYAKRSADEAVSKENYHNEQDKNTAFFTLCRRFFESGLKKYSAKMPEYEKDEVRAILTRNRDKLIEGLTKHDTYPNGKGTQEAARG